MQQNSKDLSAKKRASSAFLEKKKEVIDVDKMAIGIQNGDRLALGKAITLLESTVKAKQKLAYQLMEQLPKPTKTTLRIGVSGPPGVGKRG